MPLEIRELVIKVTVEEKVNRQNSNPGIDQEELKNSIVNDCLEIIMAKLEHTTNR